MNTARTGTVSVENPSSSKHPSKVKGLLESAISTTSPYSSQDSSGDRTEIQFWQSVLGRTAQTFLSLWPEVFQELRFRVSRLEPIFTKLENLSISADVLPRRGMQRNFDRAQVLCLLALQFVDAARIKKELLGQPEKELRRSERALRRLLSSDTFFLQDRLVTERFLERRKRIPELVKSEHQIRVQLSLIHKELRNELEQIKEDRKKISGKCGTLSQIVTQLATYLFISNGLSGNIRAKGRTHRSLSAVYVLGLLVPRSNLRYTSEAIQAPTTLRKDSSFMKRAKISSF